jgi:hypothetical protein
MGMAQREAQATKSRTVTRAELFQLFGELDDTVVTAILATDATPAQAQEAQVWALGDAADLGRQGHELSPQAAAVYNILTTDPNFLGPDREP